MRSTLTSVGLCQGGNFAPPVGGKRVGTSNASAAAARAAASSGALTTAMPRCELASQFGSDRSVGVSFHTGMVFSYWLGSRKILAIGPLAEGPPMHARRELMSGTPAPPLSSPGLSLRRSRSVLQGESADAPCLPIFPAAPKRRRDLRLRGLRHCRPAAPRSPHP